MMLQTFFLGISTGLLILPCYILGSTEPRNTRQCIGECITTSSACNDIQQETDCPPDTQCCVDTLNFRHFGYDSQAVVNGNKAETYQESATPSETKETKLDPEIADANYCPGACLPEEYSQYCEYQIDSKDICKPGFLCCMTDDQVKLLQEDKEPAPSPTKRSGFDSLEKHNCPGSCIESIYAESCREFLDEYECPAGYTCCNILGAGIPDTAIYGQDVFQQWMEENARKSLVIDDEGNVHRMIDGEYSMLEVYTPPEDDNQDDFTPLTELVLLNGKVVIFTDNYGKLYQHFVPDDGSEPIEHDPKSYDYIDGYYGMRRKGNLNKDVNAAAQLLKDASHYEVNSAHSKSSQEESQINRFAEELFQANRQKEFEQIQESESSEKNSQDMELEDIQEAIKPLSLQKILEKPECPGSCISSFLSFSCFGNRKVHAGFSCPGRYVCCANLKDVEKQERYLKIVSRYLNLQLISPITSRCGVKGGRGVSDSLINKDSSPGEWCWQVAIISAQNQYVCSGAVIDDSWVLTSAHCVVGSNSEQQIYIRAGVTDLTDPDDNEVGQTRRVIHTFAHHDYDSVSLDNDLALLGLEEPLNFNANVCKVCLPNKNTIIPEGSRCKVTGYGFPSKGLESFVPGGVMSLKIHEAGTIILKPEECTSNITQVLKTPFILPSNSFCAGYLDKQDSCQKDAGGSLVCKSEDFYVLQGLVSWSFGCMIQNVPTLYVSTAPFVDWINQRMAVAAWQRT